MIDEGIANRSDLLSLRRAIESERYSWMRQKTEAGLTFSVDADFNQQLTPDSLQNRGWTFLASYPLFDGGLLREQARETSFRIESDKASLMQSEHAARAEIESAFAEVTQNRERVDAAKLAIEAAQSNYDAASSRRNWAQGM